MRSSLVFAALLAPVGIFAQVQVNFYSDLYCQDYLGSEYGTQYDIGPTGGPAGSFSALYVTLPECYDNSPYSYFCEDSTCSAKTGGTGTQIGECWSYTLGVWVEACCGGCP